MRKIVYMATMCVSACLSMKGFADGDATNKEVSSTLTNVKPSFVESVDAKINRLNQLEQSVSSNSGDIAEIHQLKEEMDKTGVDLALSNGMHKVASTKRAESLAMLTRLQKGYRLGIETTVNPAPAQKQVINEIRATRKTLAEAGAIPVWDGSKWFDGRNLAINNAGLPMSAVNALVDLNFWEQNYGSLSVPEKMQGIIADSGETSAAISRLKNELEHAGFRVELDKSLGIWKVRTEK